MAARSYTGTDKSFYLAAKGGHNDESHNHNDVGTFIIYADGRPVLIDAGAQTYTAKTFSRQRYELWNNQSAYHNLPTINGVMQKEGHQYSARDVQYTSSEQSVQLMLDISHAYPSGASVRSWKRSITLNRGKNVVVIDEYELSKFIKPMELNFLTSLETDISEPGIIILSEDLSDTAKNYYLHYPNEKLEPHIETISIDDNRMQSSWGKEITRIVFKGTDQVLKSKIQIIVED
jgi:hypothetical protein